MTTGGMIPPFHRLDLILGVFVSSTTFTTLCCRVFRRTEDEQSSAKLQQEPHKMAPPLPSSLADEREAPPDLYYHNAEKNPDLISPQERNVRPRVKANTAISPHICLVQRRFFTRTETGNRKNQPWELLCHRQSPELVQNGFYDLPFSRGGSLRIWTNFVSTSRLGLLNQEMRQRVQYRQYRIQSENEPRIHALYHEQSTPPPSASPVGADALNNRHHVVPGYRYAQVTMKSRPLSDLPHIASFCNTIKPICGVGEVNDASAWGIGVNLIYYRDGKDRMGLHADNDQGEQKVVTVLVDGPPQPRQVLVQTKRKDVDNDNLEEEFRLFLRPGDAYCMDGVMQDFYLHGVPRDGGQVGGGYERLAIVLRAGIYCEYTKDSGRPVVNLTPPTPKPLVFGSIAELCLGGRYTRGQLVDTGGHNGRQRGVCGNQEEGCFALISSGKQDNRFEDFCPDSHYMLYAVRREKGGQAAITSALKNESIRVFEKLFTGLRFIYEYNGLYDIVAVDQDDDKVLVVLKPFKTRWVQYSSATRDPERIDITDRAQKNQRIIKLKNMFSTFVNMKGKPRSYSLIRSNCLPAAHSIFYLEEEEEEEDEPEYTTTHTSEE